MIWTVGHSNRSVEALLEILRVVPIASVADVRTVPRSRRNPQFDTDNLCWELEQAGIDYRHAPELGGLRKPRPDSINTALKEDGFRGYADHMQTSTFSSGIDRLIRDGAAMATAVLCAEASPWHCHRSLLSDGLVVREVAVTHLLDRDRSEPHNVNPLARIEGHKVTYPGLL